MHRRRGFTIVELMIATALTGLIVAAAASSFVFMARGMVRLEHYADMEQQARYALEYFARDARGATDISGISGASDPAAISAITLTVPTGTTATATVGYGWDAANRQFYRTLGGRRQNLVSNVRLVRFTPFKLSDPSRTGNVAASNRETDQIQIRLEAEQIGAATGQNTNVVVSARYILRNKPKTN